MLGWGNDETPELTKGASWTTVNLVFVRLYLTRRCINAQVRCCRIPFVHHLSVSKRASGVWISRRITVMAQPRNSSQEKAANNDLRSSYIDLALNQIQVVPITQFGLLLFSVWFIARNFLPPTDGMKVPSVGYRSVFEPSFLVRLRFALGALSQINEGYAKV